MRYKDKRCPAFLQSLYNMEKMFDLTVVQSCRRLIKNQQLCLKKQCLRYLQKLLLACRKPGHLYFRINFHTQFLEKFPRLFYHSLCIDFPEFIGIFSAKKNIFINL